MSARAASGTRRGLGDLDDVAGATGLVNARTNTSLNLDNIEPPSTKTNSQTQVCTRFQLPTARRLAELDRLNQVGIYRHKPDKV